MLMIRISEKIKNVMTIFGGDLVSKILAIISVPILARYLGPENYGRYSFILSYTYIFSVIADFGLNDLYVRDVARNRLLASKYFASSLLLKPALSLLSIVGLLLIVYFLGYSEEVKVCMLIFSSYLLFNALINSIISLINSYEKLIYISFIRVFNSLIWLLGILFVIGLNGSLRFIIFARIITIIIVFAVGLFLIINKLLIKPNFKEVKLSFIKEILTNALPFLTVGIVHILSVQIDIVMLSKMKGEIYVGWFVTAANDLFFGLFIIPAAISTVVYPIFSRHYMESILRLRASCNFIIKILTVLGVAISVGTFMLAPELIHFIFGSKYDNSIVILKIISLAICFAFIRDPIGFALAAIGKVRTLMWLNVFILIINIILNLILIPILAHIGAAISSLICFFISLLLGYYSLNKEIKHIVIFPNFIKPIFSAIIMGLFIHMLKGHNLFLLIGGSIIIYSILIFGLKTFKTEEIQIMKGV